MKTPQESQNKTVFPKLCSAGWSSCPDTAVLLTDVFLKAEQGLLLLPKISLGFFYRVVCLESDCKYSSNVISEEKWEKKAWTPNLGGCRRCFLTRAVQNKAGAHSLGTVHYKTRLAPAGRRSGIHLELRAAIALCRQFGCGVLTAERVPSVPRQTTRSGDLQKTDRSSFRHRFWGYIT